jgi:protein PsiE
MVAAREATLHDILLLFIYLELGAMVGIYFRTDELPVEFLLYITITVMTRKLISAEDLTETRILVTTGAVLILAIAVLILRYGAHRFQSGNPWAASRSRPTCAGLEQSHQHPVGGQEDHAARR